MARIYIQEQHCNTCNNKPYYVSPYNVETNKTTYFWRCSHCGKTSIECKTLNEATIEWNKING